MSVFGLQTRCERALDGARTVGFQFAMAELALAASYCFHAAHCATENDCLRLEEIARNCLSVAEQVVNRQVLPFQQPLYRAFDVAKSLLLVHLL